MEERENYQEKGTCLQVDEDERECVDDLCEHS